MAGRIDLVVDPARSDPVTIATPSGTVSNEGFEGETLHPMETKVMTKFRRHVSPVLGAATDQTLADIMSLEHPPDIRQLTERLRPAHSVPRRVRA